MDRYSQRKKFESSMKQMFSDKLNSDKVTRSIEIPMCSSDITFINCPNGIICPECDMIAKNMNCLKSHFDQTHPESKHQYNFFNRNSITHQHNHD